MVLRETDFKLQQFHSLPSSGGTAPKAAHTRSTQQRARIHSAQRRTRTQHIPNTHGRRYGPRYVAHMVAEMRRRKARLTTRRV